MTLDNVNLQAESERPINEFPFFEERLKPIDYKAIIEAKHPFSDPHWLAEESSIMDDFMMREPRVQKWQTLVWKRPSEVYGDGNFTLYDKIDPNDILQGDCGDCYFLSGLASLAEYPDRIKRIFLTQEINEAGCYAVQFYICGEKRTVVVDDRFPYCPHKERWAFSRTSSSNEIWVLIVEKAWAKVFGSYQRIEAGTTGEALNPLTGCPTKFFIHDDVKSKEHLWQTILFADTHKFPMCTAVASS